MRALQWLYNKTLRTPRLRSLTRLLEPYLPEEGTVLDIGCGDGSLAVRLQEIRPGLRFSGVEVTLRENAYIPLQRYDGIHLPYPDNSFDYTMLIHVLHHTNDYRPILAEAARVARKGILLMDHINETRMDYVTLMIRDWPANVPFGIHTPYNYISRRAWSALFASLHLHPETYCDRLFLYGKKLDFLLGRRMDFICRLAHD